MPVYESNLYRGAWSAICRFTREDHPFSSCPWSMLGHYETRAQAVAAERAHFEERHRWVPVYQPEVKA